MRRVIVVAIVGVLSAVVAVGVLSRALPGLPELGLGLSGVGKDVGASSSTPILPETWAQADLSPTVATGPSPSVSMGRARRGSTVIRREPSEASEVIVTLFFDTPLPLLDCEPRQGSPEWYKTRIWGSLEGWVKASQVDTGPLPEKVRPFWETQDPVGLNRGQSGQLLPLAASGRTNTQVNIRAGIGVGNEVLAVLDPNAQVRVDGWAADGDFHPWFHVARGSESGWVYGAYIDLEVAKASAHSDAIWQPIAGRGMWLPNNFVELVNPRYLVEAATALKLSHLYVEVGESQAGFFGRSSLDSLLPIAHSAGINVIGWVMTSLGDIPGDTALTAEIAAYRTADGHRVDGIAADIEQNVDLDDVKVYAEVTRLSVGPERLLVATIWPAGSWMGRTYPIHRVLAPVFDAITPMAYWSAEERAYSYDEVYEFVYQAVNQMRQEVGDPHYPVAVIGQMYDTFGRNGIGEYSPGGQEIRAAMQAAKDARAVGISFFQWGTATPEEWEAFRDFP